ncbi:MAG: DUF1972 domain-containing protein [Cetobacterium sp.]
MKKINIGFFGTRGLGNYGGFETIAQKLNDYLDSSRFNLFISQEVDEQEQEYLLEKINKTTTLIKQKKTWIKKYSKELDNIINESRIINKCIDENPWNLDAILQCGSTPGILMKKSKESPLIIWNPDGIEWKRAKFPWYARKILYYSTILGIKKSDAVSVDSKSIGIDLKKMIGSKPEFYLPSGTDIIINEDVQISDLKEFGIDKNNYYIMVGRAVPENNILEILNYFLETKTSKKLIIIANFSEDEYSKKCLDLIQKNSNRIIYKGPVYDQKKLKSLRYFAYAYLHGHSVGGTNPSLLEALGAGNPCVCYNVPYNKEVAEDAGLYFKNKDEFINCLMELEEDSFEYNLKKNKAQEIIKKRFTWEYIARLHEEMILKLLIKGKE